MKKYLTRKNLGWVLATLLSGFLLMSAAGKLFGGADSVAEMKIGHIQEWLMIIGIGELACIILFLIPKTMKLGTVLLSAYFGGAIMFHMSHPDPTNTSFTAPVVFLIITWIVTWVRGNDLVDLK